MPFAPIEPALIARVRRLIAAGETVTETARRTGLTRDTVRKYRDADAAAGRSGRGVPAELPPANHEAANHEAAELPAAVAETYEPHRLDAPGPWLVLSDVHAPYHDRPTVELAVAEARRRGAVGVLLDGDLLDSHEVSAHDKDPTAPRYVHEIEVARKLLAYVRGRLPRAQIVLKEGNHEERLSRYVIQRAPALFGLEGIDLPSLLHLADYGVGWVGGRRVVALGKLNVIHGHEYPGGVASPVNPARGLYLKARSVAMAGHHHQTSTHHARDIRGRAEAAWSLGCACYLFPRYCPLNNWNHGFAFVDLAADGSFAVTNLRVFNGKVV